MSQNPALGWRDLRDHLIPVPTMDRGQLSSKEPPCPPEEGGCSHFPSEQALPELCLSRSWDFLTAGMSWVWGHPHQGRGAGGCPRQSPQQCPCPPQHRGCSNSSTAHKALPLGFSRTWKIRSGRGSPACTLGALGKPPESPPCLPCPGSHQESSCSMALFQGDS